ncbi:MAG: isochorismatase, partial [Thermodesulfobacteriota bacterium]
MTSEKQKAAVLEAVNNASAEWKSAFNSGNAAGCAAQYEENAVMHARPFGTFTGTAEIQ